MALLLAVVALLLVVGGGIVGVVLVAPLCLGLDQLELLLGAQQHALDLGQGGHGGGVLDERADGAVARWQAVQDGDDDRLVINLLAGGLQACPQGLGPRDLVGNGLVALQLQGVELAPCAL